MELDMIKRGLRAEIKKRQKETYATCQTNVRDMCTDVLSKLEEQEARIHELESMSHTDNSAVIDLLSDELEKLRPMEAALEIAEADNKKYIERIKELEAENAELKRMDTEHTVHIAKMNADLRKTQRALWLTRSRRAFAEACYNNQIARRYEDRNEKTIAECYDKEVAKWKNSDRKCRAKAKEYE